MATMTEAERFFYEHAGWSVPPGREECARALAAAEAAAKAAGWWASTETDPDVMDDDAGSVDMVASGEWVNLGVILHGPPAGDALVGEPVTLGSLWGVVVESESDPYVRVVAAELAAEAIAETGAEVTAAV